MGRLDKVNEQMRRELSFIIQRDMEDPRLNFVSITYVQVSKDLRSARVYYSILGDAKAAQDAHAAFQSARGHIRKLLGRAMLMRFTPELNFIFDDSIVRSAQIEEKLKEIEDGD